jgi:hypothetical protein
MKLTIFGALAFGALAALLFVAPLMYSAAALVRKALWKAGEPPSGLRIALLPAFAELFLAVAFTAAVTGAVRGILQLYPEAPAAWLWAAGFVIAALPGVLRWLVDFLADPGADPSPVPGWLETPVIQAAAFVLFAVYPGIAAAGWGWVPFARGPEHPVWTSVAVICVGAASLKAFARRRRVHFIPVLNAGTVLTRRQDPITGAAGRV